jgi:MoaA/NifB/PqqE/SkfB family radical SAM enzyme
MAIDRVLDRFWRRFLPKRGAAIMNIEHVVMTPRRVFNLHRLFREYDRGATKLKAKPIKLIIEATNVCNLSCPGCFTGLGENGRVRSAIKMDFFRRVLDELGGTLLEMEFYNWGEPFLCKTLIPMIEEASNRGIATVISTNFSVPFDQTKAEALVRSGLSVLAVSLDGTRQESYAQYRRDGDLELVLRNAQLVLDAKKRLHSKTPRMIWNFHVFEHNVDDVAPAQALAKEMGFDDAFFSKGYTYDHEWTDDRFSYFPPFFTPVRCMPPWFWAVIHPDGGVAACCGAYYREDDLGQLATTPGEEGAARFRDVWNNTAFQHARGLFAPDIAHFAPSCGGICDDCLQTATYQANLHHIASGQSPETFRPAFSPNDGHNYFYHRRPKRDTRIALKLKR